jgi:predicted amino acid dehydrogenase
MTVGVVMESAKFTSSDDVILVASAFHGLVINTDGVNDGTVVVYDGNPGTIKFEFTCLGADTSYGALFSKAISMETSIRFTIAGTGASVIIMYEPKFW